MTLSILSTQSTSLRSLKTLEAKTKDEREANCWISPKGKWFNCPFADHALIAQAILKHIYDVELDYDEAGYILIKKYNWILVHDDYAVGTVIQNQDKMTKEQYVVLEETFGGNTPLFRGWTVNALWRHRKATVP